MTATVFGDFSQRLLKQVANIEAFIDFAESEEIEDGVPRAVESGVRALAGEFARHLAAARAGERLRSGVRVAIVGEPNVGKSTLLNLLAQVNPSFFVSIFMPFRFYLLNYYRGQSPSCLRWRARRGTP